MSDALVKNPHTKTSYTKAQLGELVKCGNPDNGHLHFIENYFHNSSAYSNSNFHNSSASNDSNSKANYLLSFNSKHLKLSFNSKGTYLYIYNKDLRHVSLDHG